MPSRTEQPVGPTPTGSGPDRLYLPDFCTAPSVLAVVIIAQLVALLLALSRLGEGELFWVDLARNSLFLLWTGLGTAAALCGCRNLLTRLAPLPGSLAALGLILAVTALVSAAAWWLADSADALLQPLSLSSFSEPWAFVLRNLLLGCIAGGLALRYFYVSQQWKRNVIAEASARVRALQARIRPHFLFNSMNTIAALTRSQPALAEDAVTDLSELFRAALRESRELIPLGEELEVARTYCRIEGLRLGDRLAIDWDVDALPADAVVPPLILQPLIENAVYHGIEGLGGGGRIEIRGRRQNRLVVIEVINPHGGHTGRTPGSGSAIGLANVRERLQLTFPGEGRLDWTDEGGRFHVTLRFPSGPAA
ncbi:MAG: sensor histidine kinase [Steroidobacteraceae bacterium]